MNKPLYPVAFVVRRPWDSGVVAVVTAQVDREELLQEEAFLAALKKITTQWTTSTEVGKAATAYAGDDFNIGDLLGHAAGAEFDEIAARHGIYYFCDDEKQIVLTEDWEYDTVLVEAE